MPIRLYGVPLQPSIIDIIAFMLTMFRTLDEILNNIHISQYNVLCGKKIKI